MTSQQILQSDVLDILFEKRNKLYGAYLLRRNYHRELVKALVIAIGSALLLLFLFRPSPAKSGIVREEGKVVVVEQFIPPAEQKKPEPPRVPEPPKRQVAQRMFTNQIAITDKEIKNSLPPQDLLSHAAVSNLTTPGTEVDILQPSLTPEVKSGGGGNMGNKEPGLPKEVLPDRQPQFPGGMQAWMAFLNKNLRAPAELENGEKRTVLIRFHVAEDGTITNFQVIQSAGSAFDNEVIRVLKKMPRWMPALQQGRPVSVSFTQPVTFVGLEE